MTPIFELGFAVRARRSDMGLTQASVAVLSGLSRATVNQLEMGTVKDLSLNRAARLLDVLGLSMTIAPPRIGSQTDRPKKSQALDIAARTASVSYKAPVSAQQLRDVLMAAGTRQADILPHVYALLDEAPVSLLASVVEQLHEESGIERAKVWRQMRDLAHQLKSGREIWR